MNQTRTIPETFSLRSFAAVICYSVFHIIPTHRRCNSGSAMDDFNSEEDSDYTNYWRDWVGAF